MLSKLPTVDVGAVYPGFALHTVSLAIDSSGETMTPYRSRRGITASVVAACIALCCAWSSSAGARELILMVPSTEDEATREFIEVMSSAQQIKEAGLTFRLVRSDAIAVPGQQSLLVLQGTVQLALLQASEVPGYQTDTKDLKFTSLLSHPLIVSDSRQQFFVEDSVVGDAVKQELGRKGFVVLEFWNSPSSSLVFKRPVQTYADLKGQKVRAPELQAREVLQAFGASPTQLAGGEVYAALERGAVDASEASFDRVSSYVRVAKGGSIVSSFQHAQGFLVANEAAWISLRQRERAAIEAAVAEAKTRARTAVMRADAALVDVARTNGLTYVSFASMKGDQSTVRSTWLRRVGNEGASALKLLDQVIREQPPAPPSTPGIAPRSSAPARVFFATNRNDEGGGDLSYRFGIDRSSTLLCGEISYTSESNRNFGIAHKGAISVAGSRTVSGADPCAQLVGASAKGSNGALIVFIHGYRNTFDFAVRRAIAFAQDFGISAPVLVFSWPSFGTVSGYVYDIGSVSFTRPFAKDLLDALHRESDVRSISLLAHSMGGQIAFQLLEFAQSVGKPIDTIVFVAPDVPRVNFLQGIRLYGAPTRLVTMYVNEHDRALLLSQEVNKQPPAGLGGRFRLTTNGVETVDVSEVDRQFFEINHSHGFDVREVASDVSMILRQRAKASMRNLPSATQDGFTYWLIRP